MGGRWLIKNRTSDYSAIFVKFILKFYSFPLKKRRKIKLWMMILSKTSWLLLLHLQLVSFKIQTKVKTKLFIISLCTVQMYKIDRGGQRIKKGCHEIGAWAEIGQNGIRGGGGVQNSLKLWDIIYVRSLREKFLFAGFLLKIKDNTISFWNFMTWISNVMTYYCDLNLNSCLAS